MSKEKTTPKKAQTTEIQDVESNLKTALKHHVEMRKQIAEVYQYHHQMVLHLREQLEKFNQLKK